MNSRKGVSEAASIVTHAAPLEMSGPRRETHALLPDPEPREVKYTVISVDDHIVEPPELFVGRVPSQFSDQIPRVVTDEDGTECWEYDGNRFKQIGLNAVAGRPKEDWLLQAANFDEIRRGCFDPQARVRDMDINGVWASLNFPSQITGFCGSVFARTKDADLGFAVMQAWNDWMAEEWWGAAPERFIPLGITWLRDPERGAAEIRRNAARGFTAVTLPEQPHRIGLPSLFTDYWDPILRACEETETVICLHVGSTGLTPMPPDAPQHHLGATLFPALSLNTCAEWLWSGIPLRYPDIKITLAEGGIGWVPMLMDRLEYMMAQSSDNHLAWLSKEIGPTEVLQRNFWFCTIDDPSSLAGRYRIGVENILFEVDYPHADSTWPDTQAYIEKHYRDVPVEEIRQITHLNAAKLFRHPLPALCLPANDGPFRG